MSEQPDYEVLRAECAELRRTCAILEGELAKAKADLEETNSELCAALAEIANSTPLAPVVVPPEPEIDPPAIVAELKQIYPLGVTEFENELVEVEPVDGFKQFEKTGRGCVRISVAGQVVLSTGWVEGGWPASLEKALKMARG